MVFAEPQKARLVPDWIPLYPVPQPSTSVPIRAPQGLGVCPAVGGGGLLAGGGPALAGSTAPLEEEVDEGLGAVQPWGGSPCPVSLWLLLLPLLLWGQRRGVGVEGPGDTTPNGVWHLGRGIWAGNLAGQRDYWGALTGRQTCCVDQGVSRSCGVGLWGACQAARTGVGLCRAIGCPGQVAWCPYGVGGYMMLG